MRLGWLALPLVMAVEACAPVRTYQEAARSLRFTLDRVEPRLQLAFPLDQSRLALQITLGVENPSTTPFHLQGFLGDLSLEATGGLLLLGHVELQNPMDLPPGGRAELTVAVSYLYRDLRAQWGPLQEALRKGAAGAWSLQGDLKLSAYGVSWQVPVKTRRTFGGAP